MKKCGKCGEEMEYPHITRVRGIEFYWCRDHCPMNHYQWVPKPKRSPWWTLHRKLRRR